MSPANRYRMPLPTLDLTGGPPPSIEPFRRLVDVRRLSCAHCGVVCRYESAASGRPESPEFLKASADVWLGFVIDERTDTLELSLVCSERCLQALLVE